MLKALRLLKRFPKVEIVSFQKSKVWRFPMKSRLMSCGKSPSIILFIMVCFQETKCLVTSSETSSSRSADGGGPWKQPKIVGMTVIITFWHTVYQSLYEMYRLMSIQDSLYKYVQFTSVYSGNLPGWGAICENHQKTIHSTVCHASSTNFWKNNSSCSFSTPTTGERSSTATSARSRAYKDGPQLVLHSHEEHRMGFVEVVHRSLCGALEIRGAHPILLERGNGRPFVGERPEK